MVPNSSNQRNAVYLRDQTSAWPLLSNNNNIMYMNYLGQQDQNCVELPTSSQHGMFPDHLVDPESGTQGLSLSLTTHLSSVPSFHFRHPNAAFSSLLLSHTTTLSGDADNSPNKQLRNACYSHPGFNGANHDEIKQEALLNSSTEPKHLHPAASLYGFSGFASTIPSSKYLKPSRQLLEEVVNMGKALMNHEAAKHQGDFRETDMGPKHSTPLPSAPGMTTENQEQTTADLSPAQRQDLHNKLTKLLSMLDEVDRRYRQYYHQMQIVVSSFDVISGCGAAKPYTALALETISRHFRCLRDTISRQVKTTRQRLGEQDASGNSKGSGISRLRHVDQHLRQQRALQHFGMIQQHAWRPQRGLPESSVSILRAWLFEHFLNPYPKDSDKITLARQTGLTRSQVSNWFINARVHLWKPMVEEMYKEEFGDVDMDSVSSSESASKSARDENMVSEDGREKLQPNKNPPGTERCQTSQIHESIPNAEMSGSMTRANFHNCLHGDDGMDYTGMRLRGNPNHGVDPSSVLQHSLIQADESENGRFMSAADTYQMAEMGRFASVGVSLTLGLQRCDNGDVPISGGAHSNFLTMRGHGMYTAASSLGPNTADYDCMDPEDQPHRFSSSHMLHDFVA